MGKIKIAFVIDHIDEAMGGTERQLLLLLKHLNRSKFAPYLCCLRGIPVLDNGFNPCSVYSIGFNSFYHSSDYVRLVAFSRFLRSEKIDIVQTHLRDGNIVGTLAAKMAGIKKIVSTRRNHGHWYNKRELFILKILRRVTTNYLVNAEVIKSFMCEVEGIHRNKIDVIHNGFEISNFSKKSDDVRRQYREAFGVGPDARVIVIVANLRKIKCIDVFLRAAQSISSKYPSSIFFIVGDGVERGRLFNLANELGITDKARFLGKRSDISNILAVADIGVLTSSSEGLSNSIIEYMAMGLPVVCTDVGGSGEIVQDGKNGYLTPPNDPQGVAEAVCRILASTELAKRMGEESLKRVNSMFNLGNFIRRSEEYYTNLVKAIYI